MRVPVPGVTRREVIRALTLLTLSAPLPLAAAPLESALQTITVGGEARSYLLRLPPGYDKTKPVPLVLMLHGRGSSPKRRTAATAGRNSPRARTLSSATPLPSSTISI